MKKSLLLIPLASLVCLFTGCAALTRTTTDVGLGAGGAAIGGVLSKGNPLAIVGGAAGGVLLGEGLHYANGKLNNQSYQTGYDKGRGNAQPFILAWSATSLTRPATTRAGAMPSNSNTGFTSPCSRQRRATKAGSGSTKCNCPNRSLTA